MRKLSKKGCSVRQSIPLAMLLYKERYKVISVRTQPTVTCSHLPLWAAIADDTIIHRDMLSSTTLSGNSWWYYHPGGSTGSSFADSPPIMQCTLGLIVCISTHHLLLLDIITSMSNHRIKGLTAASAILKSDRLKTPLCACCRSCRMPHPQSVKLLKVTWNASIASLHATASAIARIT